jgi:hypothetical protein
MQSTAGAAPLAWEEATPASAARLRELRGLKRSVLQCLDRSSGIQPTSSLLLQS